MLETKDPSVSIVEVLTRAARVFVHNLEARALPTCLPALRLARLLPWLRDVLRLALVLGFGSLAPCARTPEPLLLGRVRGPRGLVAHPYFYYVRAGPPRRGLAASFL